MMRTLLHITACFCVAWAAASPAAAGEEKRVAAVVSVYHQNSHADVLVSRLVWTDTLDGQGRSPQIKLASLYTDQVPENDISRRISERFAVPIYSTVAEALTLGTGKLAVDGVMLVAEHGQYPVSTTGQVQYPKRRLFEQIVKVFSESGRVVPVFVDKHLADNWADAHWIYQTAREMQIPLMAGSTLPSGYRYPPEDLDRGEKVRQIVAVSYHTLDAYGFHALEAVQALAERRSGGETGIKSVQTFSGESVWQAGEQGVYDRQLLEIALSRLKRPPAADRPLKEQVIDPVLFVVDYRDGLRANVLTLNNVVGEWAAAWRYEAGDRIESTLFWTQEARPFAHFSTQLAGIERLMLSGKPAWPAERTLMTSGTLDTLLISKAEGGRVVETPFLGFAYESDWDWQPPPPPPPDRPLDVQ